MAAIEGVDEFREFADDMEAVSDAMSDAKEDAIKATADDFKKALTERIRATTTQKGGTLDSRSSPYSPGGTNDSSGSNLHIADKSAWRTELVGDDMAVVFPEPEVMERASWLEHGTADHGPSGDTPMYFNVGGSTIVVGDPPQKGEPGYKNWTSKAFSDETSIVEALLATAIPGEVSGVEPQKFFQGAARDLENGNRFKKNMGREIDKRFEEQGITLEGRW